MNPMDFDGIAQMLSELLRSLPPEIASKVVQTSVEKPVRRKQQRFVQPELITVPVEDKPDPVEEDRRRLLQIDANTTEELGRIGKAIVEWTDKLNVATEAMKRARANLGVLAKKQAAVHETREAIHKEWLEKGYH